MNNHQPSAYMLQGFFFQERMSMGVEIVPIDGAVAIIRQALFRNMFAGIIDVDASSLDWAGSPTDAFGNSALDRIELSDTVFTFDKIYENRDDRIHYTFRKSGELRLGEYNDELVGSGSANCILTPVSWRIFQPTE